MTLLEMLLTISLLGLLMGAVLTIYVSGARAWRKTDARSELLGEAQVCTSNLVADLERSTYAGLELGSGGDALAIASLYDKDGKFELTLDGTPVWQRWIVYYLRDGAVHRTEVPWTAPLADRAEATTLASLNPPLTVDDYCSGGRVLARNVYDVDFSVIPGTSLVSARLELRKKRYGHPEPEKVRLDTLIKTRN